MGHLDNGTSGHRDNGTMGHRDRETPGQWEIGTVGHRDSGTPGQKNGYGWRLTQHSFMTTDFYHFEILAYIIGLLSSYDDDFGIIFTYFLEFHLIHYSSS